MVKGVFPRLIMIRGKVVEVVLKVTNLTEDKFDHRHIRQAGVVDGMQKWDRACGICKRFPLPCTWQPWAEE